MYITGIQPHILKKKIRLEIFNEAMVVLITLNMFCFTDFIGDNQVIFDNGYVFVFIMCLILFASVLYMLTNLFQKWRTKRRKNQN
jgi:hypothetical protein